MSPIFKILVQMARNFAFYSVLSVTTVYTACKELNTCVFPFTGFCNAVGREGRDYVGK